MAFCNTFIYFPLLTIGRIIFNYLLLTPIYLYIYKNKCVYHPVIHCLYVFKIMLIIYSVDWMSN